jgi:[FeFe] hydrogenase H-cluster maturation GTPase HydF
VPIDKEAPKGRIILPQVQVIRDGLDNGFASIVVTEKDYLDALTTLKRKPDIVICDSQVVDRMVRETPPDIPCTTFSIVFARNRGNLTEAARAARVLGRLKPGDRILVAEACSHHPIEDDIGRIKLPKWLEEKIGGKLEIETTAGRDFPDDLSRYKLIIHCGSCMITRREMLSRSEKAEGREVPMTNYGVAIACLRGVLERVLSPFPEALAAYREENL